MGAVGSPRYRAALPGGTIGMFARTRSSCAGQPGRAEIERFLTRGAVSCVRFRVRRTWNGVQAVRLSPSTTHAKHLGDSRVDELVNPTRDGSEHLARGSCSFCDRLGAGGKGGPGIAITTPVLLNTCPARHERADLARMHALARAACSYRRRGRGCCFHAEGANPLASESEAEACQKMVPQPLRKSEFKLART